MKLTVLQRTNDPSIGGVRGPVCGKLPREDPPVVDQEKLALYVSLTNWATIATASTADGASTCKGVADFIILHFKVESSDIEKAILASSWRVRESVLYAPSTVPISGIGKAEQHSWDTKRNRTLKE